MSALSFQSYRGHESHRRRAEASDLRWRVFVTEQGVPPVLEVDARDFLPHTIHVVGVDRTGAVTATARILQLAPGRYHVGRVAVSEQNRGRGFGAEIMAEITRIVAAQDADAVISLEAQVHAIGFYQNCGYQPTPDPRFLDAGILHQKMEKQIGNPGQLPTL